MDPLIPTKRLDLALIDKEKKFIIKLILPSRRNTA